MGKGDKKTRKGKQFKGSYGKSRLRKKKDQNLIKIINLKKWSLERLFIEIGQHDYTVSIVFKENSPSFIKYGRSITGILYYTKRDRKLMNIKINSGIRVETNGKVLFTTLLEEKLTKELVKELLTVGFQNKDILFLDYYSYQHNHTYYNKNNKKLTEPIKIKITNDSSYEESYRMMYIIYKKRIEAGDLLIDFEKIEMMAIQSVFSITESESRFIHNAQVESRKVDYDFLLEEIRFNLGKTETLDEQVSKAKLDYVKKIVDTEFIKSGINPQKALEIVPHLGLYLGLLQIGIFYRDKIILYCTSPKVILNFEGFMHIVFRHCKVCNIGKNNVAKSKIPYELTDIERLIESCIEPLNEDIKSHFEEHPGKRYSRFGDQMIRFNGDYYEIQINEKGIIETFYNHEDQK
jgi:ribosomal small subunit protein bTHX